VDNRGDHEQHKRSEGEDLDRTQPCVPAVRAAEADEVAAAVHRPPQAEVSDSDAQRADDDEDGDREVCP
jgi:hypothetical protein